MRRISFKSESGAILPIVIILALALTITGIAFLNAGVMENSLVRRRIHQDQAFWLADGGIEHFRLKCNLGERPKDWPESSDKNYQVAIVQTTLGEGDYWVWYFKDTQPYVISTGRITKKAQEIVKEIKLEIDESSVFDYGIFGDDWVSVQGSPTIGSLTAERAKVGTNSTSKEEPYAIEAIGSPTVDADITIGPNGDIVAAINADEDIISLANRKSIAEKILPVIELPDWVGLIPRTDLSISGQPKVSEIMTLHDGKYIGDYTSFSMSAKNDKLIVDKDCELVIGTLDITGGQIEIESGKHLTLYITQSAKIAGNGIVNIDKDSTLLKIYGTEDCNEIDYIGTENFYGAICAPTATITTSGKAYISGSLIGKEVRIQGNPEIWWDPALSQNGDLTSITLENWQEYPS